MSKIVKAANATVVANFGDIAVVAQTERHRIFGPEPEPADVQHLRHQASAEASDLIQAAFLQAEEIREQARRQGYDDGFESGKTAAMESAAQFLDQEREAMRRLLQEFVDRVDQERRAMWREAEPQIIAFVLEVAAKIIKDEARVNRDVVLSVVRGSLRRVVGTDNIRIRVHMEDLDTVRSAREELATLIESIRNVEIVADRRIDAGGCIVETSSGTIDSRLSTQVEEIAAALQLLTDEAA